MSKEAAMNDPELDALMAELEAQDDEIAKVVEAPASTLAEEPVTVTEPEPVKEPEPEPVKEPEPEPVKEPEPESTDSPFTDEEIQVSVELPPLVSPIVEKTIVPTQPVKKSQTDAEKKKSELDYYVDVSQFRKETAVFEHDLDKCMIEQPGLRAYYGAQAAHAEAQHARLKAKFDVIEATLYNEHRAKLSVSAEKVTEKLIENAVKTDPRWIKVKSRVIEAETIANINRALVDSLRDRKDMLIQLGSDRREEFKGKTRIIAEQTQHQSLAERAAAAGRASIAG